MLELLDHRKVVLKEVSEVAKTLSSHVERSRSQELSFYPDVGDALLAEGLCSSGSDRAAHTQLNSRCLSSPRPMAPTTIVARVCRSNARHLQQRLTQLRDVVRRLRGPSTSRSDSSLSFASIITRVRSSGAQGSKTRPEHCTSLDGRPSATSRKTLA